VKGIDVATATEERESGKERVERALLEVKGMSVQRQ